MRRRLKLQQLRRDREGDHRWLLAADSGQPDRADQPIRRDPQTRQPADEPCAFGIRPDQPDGGQIGPPQRSRNDCEIQLMVMRHHQHHAAKRQSIDRLRRLDGAHLRDVQRQISAVPRGADRSNLPGRQVGQQPDQRLADVAGAEQADPQLRRPQHLEQHRHMAARSIGAMPGPGENPAFVAPRRPRPASHVRPLHTDIPGCRRRWCPPCRRPRPPSSPRLPAASIP